MASVPNTGDAPQPSETSTPPKPLKSTEDTKAPRSLPSSPKDSKKKTKTTKTTKSQSSPSQAPKQADDKTKTITTEEFDQLKRDKSALDLINVVLEELTNRLQTAVDDTQSRQILTVEGQTYSPEDYIEYSSSTIVALRKEIAELEQSKNVEFMRKLKNKVRRLESDAFESGLQTRSELDKELSEAKDETWDLKWSLNFKESHVNNLRGERDQAKTEASQLKRAKTTLTTNLTNTNELVDQKMKTISKHETTIAIMKTAAAASDATIKSMKEEIEHSKEIIQELKEAESKTRATLECERKETNYWATFSSRQPEPTSGAALRILKDIRGRSNLGQKTIDELLDENSTGSMPSKPLPTLATATTLTKALDEETRSPIISKTSTTAVEGSISAASHMGPAASSGAAAKSSSTTQTFVISVVEKVFDYEPVALTNHIQMADTAMQTETPFIPEVEQLSGKASTSMQTPAIPEIEPLAAGEDITPAPKAQENKSERDSAQDDSAPQGGGGKKKKGGNKSPKKPTAEYEGGGDEEFITDGKNFHDKLMWVIAAFLIASMGVAHAFDLHPMLKSKWPEIFDWTPPAWKPKKKRRQQPPAMVKFMNAISCVSAALYFGVFLGSFFTLDTSYSKQITLTEVHVITEILGPTPPVFLLSFAQPIDSHAAPPIITSTFADPFFYDSKPLTSPIALPTASFVHDSKPAFSTTILLNGDDGFFSNCVFAIGLGWGVLKFSHRWGHGVL